MINLVQHKPRISIIVPTLNEAENIDPLLSAILTEAGAALDLEVLITDGGSTDGTIERVRPWLENGLVRFIPGNGRRGLAGDVLAAAKEATGDIVVVMDADLSHPPARLPDLVRPILAGTSDMVVGSRYVPGGATPDWPLPRRLLSRLGGALAWPLTELRDPMSGFFAVQRDRLLAVDPKAAGFKIGLEVIAEGGDSLRLAEVPITFRDRLRGESKIGILQMFAFCRRLMVLAGGAVSMGNAARWRIATLGVFAYVVILRLVFLGLPDLLPEEAYYWNYSQHLDIGYLDHPPMVAWLIWLGTTLFGNTEFGVRLGAFLSWLVAAFFCFQLTRNLFGKSAAFVAILLLAVLPFFFATGLLMMPDAPLTAAWAGALYFLERAVLGERRAAWWGVGVCIGLGMVSKYTIALLGPATLVLLLLDSRSRRWLWRPEPYGALLIAILLFSPVIVWNATHGWASFVFQGPRRLQGPLEFSLHELLGAALVLLTPVGLMAALAVLVPGRNRGAAADTQASSADRRRRRFVAVYSQRQNPAYAPGGPHLLPPNSSRCRKRNCLQNLSDHRQRKKKKRPPKWLSLGSLG